MEIIIGKQGQQPFAITDRGVSRQHVKITDLGGGKCLVEDLNSTNGTFVDGQRVVKKVVTVNTIVQLGGSYTFRVSDVLPKTDTRQVATSSMGNVASAPDKVQQKEYSIARLQKVWERYEDELNELDNRNKSINLLRSVAPIFTMASGAIAMVSRGTAWGDIISPLTFVLTGLGIILTVYAVIKSKNFDYKKEKDEIMENFENHYVCPNPDCRHFLGYTKYKILSQNKGCSYCRCKYTH